MPRMAMWLAFGLFLAPSAWAAPLHDAAGQGDLVAIEALLDHGVDIDEPGVNDETPLMHAILAGEQAVARLLIERGADIHARNAGGFTMLHAAAYAGQAEIAALLIDRGLDVDDAANAAGVTPLFPAIEQRHRSVAELLIASGADLFAKERHGHSLMARAVFKGHEDMVRLLRDHGVECPPWTALGDFFYPRCLEMTN